MGLSPRFDTGYVGICQWANVLRRLGRPFNENQLAADESHNLKNKTTWPSLAQKYSTRDRYPTKQDFRIHVLKHQTLQHLSTFTAVTVPFGKTWIRYKINGHFRNPNWRYLPCKAYVRGYTPKLWPYMVQHLHFRIQEFPLTRWSRWFTTSPSLWLPAVQKKWLSSTFSADCALACLASLWKIRISGWSW